MFTLTLATEVASQGRLVHSFTETVLCSGFCLLHFVEQLSTMDLYVEKCLPYLKKPFVNLARFRCHPYAWPADSIHPLKITNGWVQASFYLNFCLFAAYTAFVVWRTAEIWFNSTESFARKFYTATVAEIYLFAAVAYFSIVRTRDSYLPFLRSYISFLENSKSFPQFTKCRNIEYYRDIIKGSFYFFPMQKTGTMAWVMFV